MELNLLTDPTEERKKLFGDFTAWDYGSGNGGMLLGGGTRSIYLRVKDIWSVPSTTMNPNPSERD